MRLEPSAGKPVDNPTDADIAAAVRDEANEFVILSAADGYIQTSAGIVEYTLSESRQMFRTATELPPDKIIELFSAYSRGNASYRKAIDWEDVSSELRTGGHAKQILAFILLALAVAALVLWLTTLKF